MAGTIGQELKKARLAKGLNLEDVSHATKIPVSALEAMEEEDFSVFPNATYGRGFLILYSRHLEVNASEMLVAMSRPKSGKRARPDFLETDLDIISSEQTIPIVKHRIIERKPKRSAVGGVLFLLLAMMLPTVYYAGKWVGLREEAVREKTVDIPQEAAHAAEHGEAREAIRAQVITPSPRDRFSDRPVRVYPPDPEMNALIGLDSPASSREGPGR